MGNLVDFHGVSSFSLPRYFMPKVVHSLLEKSALAQLELQPRSRHSSKDFSQIAKVLIEGAFYYNHVINVD